jgi:predicted phage terminase large subunit-like protein
VDRLDQAKKVRCELRLGNFVTEMWPVLEPGTPFTWGKPIEAICEHLEAVTEGEIRRLLINVPPGCTKSMLTNVFWPCWMWGPRDQAHLRFLSVAYNAGLTRRDNRRSRSLCASPEFKKLWGDRCVLDENEQNIDKFATTAKGFRMATSIGGRVMGERADVVIIDDPNDTAKVESDAALEGALQFFTEVLPSRINSPQRSVMVCIMQRVHSRDVSGFILSQELGWEHLCLPMEYEKTRHCITSIGFEDWRRKEGELLWPERFDQPSLDRDYKVMRAWGGEFAIAGQMQQRPVSRSGGMFKKAWFHIVQPQDVPEGGKEVRGWDLAATSKAQNPRAAYTAGVKTKIVDGVLYILNVVRERKDEAEVEAWIKSIVIADGIRVQQNFPQDPAASGKILKKSIAIALEGYDIRFSPESGDKTTRAIPLSSKGSIGLIRVVAGDWNDAYISEMAMFPRGDYRDQADASSRSYGSHLSLPKAKSFSRPMVVTVHGDPARAA